MPSDGGDVMVVNTTLRWTTDPRLHTITYAFADLKSGSADGRRPKIWLSTHRRNDRRQSLLSPTAPAAHSEDVRSPKRQPRTRAASVVRRLLTYELLPRNFVSLYAISLNSPVREFFPGNGKFFRDPGKSSPVNIPNCNWTNRSSIIHVYLWNCSAITVYILVTRDISIQYHSHKVCDSRTPA